MKLIALALGISLFMNLLVKPVHASVDLHAHLFINEGLSWFFDGDFNEPLKAKKWSDVQSSRINSEALEASPFQIVVVSLYAHPLMTLSLRGAIHRQIDQAEDFVASHPDWVIAKSTSQAQAAIASKKRVLILSLETASGILENQQDLEVFVDQRGIRIVTFMHLTADHFGGVALMPGYRGLASPWDWLKSFFTGRRDEEGNRVNSLGLSADGRKIVEALIKRKVWIDLTHSSDATQADIIPLLRAAKQPLLYTHTTLRKQLHAERAITDRQLEEVKKSHGIIGLIPSQDLLGEEIHSHSQSGTPSGCPESFVDDLQTFAKTYKEAIAILGPDSVMIGSDMNSPLNYLRPSCGTGTSLDQSGLVDYTQMKELWTALKKLGVPVPEPSTRLTTRFLNTWRQVKP